MNRWTSRGTTSRRSEPKKSTGTEHSDSEQRQVLAQCMFAHTNKHTQKSLADLLPFFNQQRHTFVRKNLRQSKLLDPSPVAITQTHREFADGLLSECRLKVRLPLCPPSLLSDLFIVQG